MSDKPGIVKEGWLKRVKNQKRRYFVLCFNEDTGAAQLQYYEHEKKFVSKSEPKRTIFLRDCLGIIRKEDIKHGHILVLYTREDVFALTAESEELNSWLNDLDKLHKMENTNKNVEESKYDLVWNVKITPRGLGDIKKMTGSYKLCLKDDSLFFVDPTTQEVLNEEKLYHIRRYGHMDHSFFMEFGRSTTLGAGEVWMEVEDPLIAQKIHETLSRSVKPASGDIKSLPKKTKPNRNSMVAYSSEKYAVNPRNSVDPSRNNNNNNNNTISSPKTRRLTFIPNVFSKKKDLIRPYSKSMSGSSSPLDEEDPSPEPQPPFPPRTNPTKDDEDSEEEDIHYPRITPPVPSIPRRLPHVPSVHALSGLPEENGSIENVEEEASKECYNESTVPRCEENNYTEIKPKRRTVKQNCKDVRQGYVAEKRRSASDSRNRSASDADRRRIDSDKNSDGDRNCESDKEGGRESDDGSDSPSTYLNMKPRQRVTSDSSSEGPSPYHQVCPSTNPVDVYIKMTSPRSTPDLEYPRHGPLTAAHRPRSSHSSEDEHDLDPGCLSYVNMSPGLGVSRAPRVGSSSNESADETQAGDSGEEMFDHLNRDDVTSDDNLSQSMTGKCYVNMSPQLRAKPGSPLKKSLSHTHHGGKSDYVNVNMNRSKSMVSRPARPSPVFEIVPESSSGRSSDEEAGRHSPSSYVNIKTKAGDSKDASDAKDSYENFTPAKMEGARKDPALHYASVDFSDNNASGTNGISREHPSAGGRSSPSNYSQIDFKKSRGLAVVSSTRQRERHSSP